MSQRKLARAVKVTQVALALTLAGCASGGVLDVTFTAPTTNVDGSPITDLASYRVYYATTEQPCPGGRVVTAAAPKVRLPLDQPLKVRLTGLRMGTLYYVAVTAVNSQGGESACTPTASARARSAEQK